MNMCDASVTADTKTSTSRSNGAPLPIAVLRMVVIAVAVTVCANAQAVPYAFKGLELGMTGRQVSDLVKTTQFTYRQDVYDAALETASDGFIIYPEVPAYDLDFS